VDNNNIIEEISPEESIQEPTEEPIQEPTEEPIQESINVTKEDDDMSALTIESSINNTSEIVDQQEVIEPVKKKRAYKPRKKA